MLSKIFHNNPKSFPSLLVVVTSFRDSALNSGRKKTIATYSPMIICPWLHDFLHFAAVCSGSPFVLLASFCPSVPANNGHETDNSSHQVGQLVRDFMPAINLELFWGQVGSFELARCDVKAGYCRVHHRSASRAPE